VVGDAPSCALLGGFAIGARVALLWQHYGNAWQSPNPSLQAHRTPHALRMRAAKTPLTGDKIDAPAACAVPFRPYCGDVVTRTQNVSEYMIVLALCLVSFVVVSGFLSDNFVVGLTNVSPTTAAPTLWNYDVCGQYPGVVGDAATVHLPCASCVPPRRYLIVQIPGSNWQLNICEIEVYVGRKLIFILVLRRDRM